MIRIENTNQTNFSNHDMMSPEKRIPNGVCEHDMKIANEVNPNDVLCGRGGLTNSHVGNKKFRYIVAEHQLEYLKAKKNEKRNIAREVVSRIRQNGGRFLQRSSGSKVWSVASDKRAILKTSQALREGLDVRHKTLRSKKYVPKQNIARMSPNTATKHQSSVKGIVVDTPRIREILQENVPDLMDESTTQSFEPLFTFFPSTIPLPEVVTDDNKVHRI